MRGIGRDTGIGKKTGFQKLLYLNLYLFFSV
jgi:hypothetical protein